VQKGFKIYFKLKELPSAKEMLLRSELWRPYRTIMSIYFWKVVDGPFDW
jgi:3-methyladenine DNA glycosylase/8-oxoguanine DNA glycosylase